jgi:peptide deformylase
LILDILIYPDKRLKEKSKDVKKFDEKLHQLLDDMYETMMDRKGIGLAGIQVGRTENLFITNIPTSSKDEYPDNLVEYINPKILSSSGEVKNEEGCLSLPDYFEDVKRAKTIEVEFLDRFGNLHKTTLTGLDSVAFQHEFDHLNGKLFFERISYLKRKKFEKDWKKKFK